MQNWQALAKAVVARRVALGLRTREAFIEPSGLSPRTLGDIERARRGSYDASTLARLEAALRWPPGTVDAILTGGPPPPDLSLLPPHHGLARPVPPPGDLPGPVAELLAVLAARNVPAYRKDMLLRWLSEAVALVVDGSSHGPVDVLGDADGRGGAPGGERVEQVTA